MKVTKEQLRSVLRVGHFRRWLQECGPGKSWQQFSSCNCAIADYLKHNYPHEMVIVYADAARVSETQVTLPKKMQRVSAMGTRDIHGTFTRDEILKELTRR